MKRLLMLSLVFGSLVWRPTPAPQAVEQKGKPIEYAALPSGSSSAQSAATGIDQSASLLPQGVTAEGSVEILDLKSNSPNLVLMVEGRKELMLSLDPKITSVVWGNGWKMRLDKFILGPEPNRLRVSQHVKVSHTLKDGVELATAIHILGARPIMASSVAP